MLIRRTRCEESIQTSTGSFLTPPTWITLRELEPFASVDAALAWARERVVQRREPAVREESGTRTLVMPGVRDVMEVLFGGDVRALRRDARARAKNASSPRVVA